MAQQSAPEVSEKDIALYVETLNLQKQARTDYEAQVHSKFEEHGISQNLFAKVIIEGEDAVPANKKPAFEALKVDLKSLKINLETERAEAAKKAGFSLSRYQEVKTQIESDHKLMSEVHRRLIALQN
ncbi:MAG: hypothetical protein JJT94_12380 [Bernardetiaceae bacterium]|nr:hypothetical protein [Bernardetiaceae bacterium]